MCVMPHHILNLNLINMMFYLLYTRCRNVQSPGSRATEGPPLFSVSEKKRDVSAGAVSSKTLGHQNNPLSPSDQLLMVL